MTFKSYAPLLSGIAFLALTACSSNPDNIKNAMYWQRKEVSEATYMEGPKAQQMLNRDISRCVVELRELDRLGQIRLATPADNNAYGGTPDPQTPEGELAQWESPEREGWLRAEHLEYHDFETCMIYKGWERAEYLPYDTAKRARRDYVEAVTGERYRTRTGLRPVESKPQGDYDDLNN